MSCGVGRRFGSNPLLLWLWHRPATTALIRPLAWEPPCAMGAALEKAKTKKQTKKKRETLCDTTFVFNDSNDVLVARKLGVRKLGAKNRMGNRNNFLTCNIKRDLV